MSEEKSQNSSLLLVAIVLAVAILVIGATAIVFVNSNDPQAEALLESTLSTKTPQEKEVEKDTPPPIVEEAVGDPTATEALQDEVPAAITIDIEQAIAPRFIGNPDAPVRIYEYASLTCSHCAHFHNDILPALKEKYIDTGKVYLEFREFPLDDPALKATITARCLPEERYKGFIDLLFKTQENWAGNIDYMKNLRQNAKLAGLSDAMFDTCQDNAALKLKIAETMQAAQDKYKISATPTFVINDGAEIISGAQPLENFERAFRAVTNNAVGEAPAVE